MKGRETLRRHGFKYDLNILRGDTGCWTRVSINETWKNRDTHPVEDNKSGGRGHNNSKCKKTHPKKDTLNI